MAVAVTLTLTGLASADVMLPKIMGSGMVLQRGVAAPIWGWADQGEEVTVRFAGQEKKAIPDANGKWMARLDPLKASAEPRVMTIAGKKEVRLDDVLVGEVWLASGQSNMEWRFHQLAPEEQRFVLTQQDNQLVRAFHVERHIKAGMPLDDTIGRWKKGTALHSASAVAFFFALKLQQELEMPVAFLDASWSGERIENFIAGEGYDAMGIPYHHRKETDHEQRMQGYIASIDASLEAARKGIRIPFVVGDVYGWAENGIYNGMIAPLAPYAIRGAIWYQGESNRGWTDYFKKLQALSAGWAKVFDVENMPLHMVQVAPYFYNPRDMQDSTLCDTVWAAQYRAAKEIPGAGVVAIHDTNINIRDVHPIYKRTVGERLAALALKRQYGKDVVASGPSFAAAKRHGSRVLVSFKAIDQGLTTSDGKAPSWFELSADGRHFVKANAAIRGETVEVASAEVPDPEFVRMGWRDIAIPNLRDKNGWPVFSFPAQSIR